MQLKLKYYEKIGLSLTFLSDPQHEKNQLSQRTVSANFCGSRDIQRQSLKYLRICELI